MLVFLLTIINLTLGNNCLNIIKLLSFLRWWTHSSIRLRLLQLFLALQLLSTPNTFLRSCHNTRLFNNMLHDLLILYLIIKHILVFVIQFNTFVFDHVGLPWGHVILIIVIFLLPITRCRLLLLSINLVNYLFMV